MLHSDDWCLPFAECAMSVPFSFHAVGKVRENLEKGDGFTHGNTKPSAAPQGAWFAGRGEYCPSVVSSPGDRLTAAAREVQHYAIPV